MRAGSHEKPVDPTLNHFFLFIAGLGRYTRQSTDTAGNGTIAAALSKPFENGGGAELDRKVSLCAVA